MSKWQRADNFDNLWSDRAKPVNEEAELPNAHCGVDDRLALVRRAKGIHRGNYVKYQVILKGEGKEDAESAD